MTIRHRINTRNGTEVVELTPEKAIRLKCLECCDWIEFEIDTCKESTCKLYQFRKGE